jgi:hypothetical protein
MASKRDSPTATVLLNGKVLVAGGWNPINGPLSSAELYDPATGTWTATGSMNTARENHTATLLRNGKALVAGGHDLSSAELYDPVTGTWTATGSMNSKHQVFTATLLLNGQVLVAGSYVNGPGGTVSSSAELYDPATGTWTVTASMNTARYQHTATLLTSGQVLVSGGGDSGTVQALSSAELFSISFPVTAPALTITSSGADVVLTWPTNATGFTLQSSPNLASAIWVTNLPPPVVVNGINTLTLPLSGPERFYRLAQ